MLAVGLCRGDGDDSKQATVDWSWGTVRYRLGSSDDDDDDDEEQSRHDNESVSPPQSTDDRQPLLPLHTTELQVRLVPRR